MSQKVSNLLNQFKLDIDLPKEIKNISIQGNYTSMSKDMAMLNYINPNLEISMGEFEVYIFTGEDYKIVLAPTNKLKTLSVYHKLNDVFVGLSYDYLGYVSSRT